MVGFAVFFLLYYFPFCKAMEIIPASYFIVPVEQSQFEDCNVSSGNYKLCSSSSILLDSVHGPEDFSISALNHFYTRFTSNGRTMFKFSSEVHLDGIQVYYYLKATAGYRILLTLYSISDENYHPRRAIPSEPRGVQLAFEMGFTVIEQFSSLCIRLNANVTNLLMTPSLLKSELYISEVNFYSGPVSNETCKGTYDSETEQTIMATTHESPSPGITSTVDLHTTASIATAATTYQFTKLQTTMETDIHPTTTSPTATGAFLPATIGTSMPELDTPTFTSSTTGYIITNMALELGKKTSDDNIVAITTDIPITTEPIVPASPEIMKITFAEEFKYTTSATFSVNKALISTKLKTTLSTSESETISETHEEGETIRALSTKIAFIISSATALHPTPQETPEQARPLSIISTADNSQGFRSFSEAGLAAVIAVFIIIVIVITTMLAIIFVTLTLNKNMQKHQESEKRRNACRAKVRIHQQPRKIKRDSYAVRAHTRKTDNH